jgi:hypothetical protein
MPEEGAGFRQLCKNACIIKNAGLIGIHRHHGFFT